MDSSGEESYIGLPPDRIEQSPYKDVHPPREDGKPIVINPRYTFDQRMSFIRDTDVVRACNHAYFTREEQYRIFFGRDWRTNAPFPTYGCCPHCWISGPMCKPCGECGTPYALVYSHEDFGEPGEGYVWVDAQYISGYFGLGHYSADANEEWKSNVVPKVELTGAVMDALTNRKHLALLAAEKADFVKGLKGKAAGDKTLPSYGRSVLDKAHVRYQNYKEMVSKNEKDQMFC